MWNQRPRQAATVASGWLQVAVEDHARLPRPHQHLAGLAGGQRIAGRRRDAHLVGGRTRPLVRGSSEVMQSIPISLMP